MRRVAGSASSQLRGHRHGLCLQSRSIGRARRMTRTESRCFCDEFCRFLPPACRDSRACHRRPGVASMVFGAFERMVAFRYLRARRAEGFVSVIAGFSLLGIMLGVGTLIVVMSVFNGFGAEVLKQIL